MALTGARSLTDYVVKLIDEDATRVIAEQKRFTVDDEVFDRFMDASETAGGPNQALRDAVGFSDEQGFK